MSPLSFFQRAFPSANSVLLHGSRPVLVDTGFGSDTDAMEAWLRARDVPPERLSLIVNTHYHSDHVGGNFGLQSRYAVPIAAHGREAAMINGRDPEACGARWLDQPVEPYEVARPLEEGDVIDTGGQAWRVLHTPGHTLGHISLYEPGDRVLVLGDALHRDDVGWINPHTEGSDALDRSITVVARLAEMDVRRAYSGHGAVIEDFPATAAAALRRLRRWRDDPRAHAWHAGKRIFTHALIVSGGMTRQEVERHLIAAPWFADYARRGFGLEPARFIPELVAEILRSGAAEWREGKLTASALASTPRPGWQSAPGLPEHWPPPGTIAGRK